ncbi:unnamed protein product, partial [Vitis vinifera]
MASFCTYPLFFSLTFAFFIVASASSEAEILLTFKASIEDPMKYLSTWSNTSETHHCNWTGVTCTTTPPLSIPETIGSLKNLQVLNLGSNLLSGSVPSVFGNFTELLVLDLSQNRFLVSEIPGGIGKLEKLKQLLLQSSGFYGEIPQSFAGLQGLTILDLSQNNLTGGVPQTLGASLKNLVSFDVSQNNLLGSFPTGICRGKGLINLSLHTNSFSGSIPNSISECLNLERFQVQNNGFSGDFPNGLWSLPKIKLIRAENNRFSGEIPDSISVAAQLEQVQIDNNSFTSKIPQGLGSVRSLYRFSASLNGFYGELPPNFCDSPVMSIINLSHNSLSGLIPELKKCRKLVSLSLADNRNPELCGPGLPNSCYDDEPIHKAGGLTKLACALISLALGAGILIIAAGFFVIYRTSQRKSQMGVWRSVFFYPLRVTEHDLIMGMDEKSAVGSGGAFGRVYIISLPSGELVAVKKLLNPGSQSSKSLKNEVKTLAKIRHKNIVKLLGFCHSSDSIFLIYEFLQKGSLGDLICRPDFQFQWSTRLRIAIGVAQGLAYLHKDYVPHILHRNLKSKNILLDADLEPKLTDFALDRIVGETAFQSTMASESAFSCYIAPENGYSKRATEQMDVYSFGVVLLELVTGRQAEQAESAESIDIVKWVRRKINITDGALQVLDPKISNSSQQEMLGALEMALRCTSVMPEKRPTMFEVVRALQSLSSKTPTSQIWSCPLELQMSIHQLQSDEH